MLHHPLTTLPRLEASVTGFALRLHEKKLIFNQQLLPKPDPDSGLRDTPARLIVPSAFYKSRQLFLIVRIFPAPAVRKDTLSVWFTSEKKK
jgi:hypothetical protein